MASQNFDLQQPTHPLPNGGGSSNGLEDREALTRTGKARAFPFEPPKTGGANRKAADHVAVTAAFVAELRRASKPGHVFCATEQYIDDDASAERETESQNWFFRIGDGAALWP
ncbi:hypothetical protein D3C87_1425730 [compost metagenome]